jgi:hypothetical protein
VTIRTGTGQIQPLPHQSWDGPEPPTEPARPAVTLVPLGGRGIGAVLQACGLHVADEAREIEGESAAEIGLRPLLPSPRPLDPLE